MKDLKWHDFLEIGVDFIDEDHKRLLDIMLKIKKAIGEDDLSACAVLLKSLLKEARDHFTREEEFLAKAKYPQLENHKIYHNELLIKAEVTKSICEGLKVEHDLNECFDSMANFLIDDILRGDIGFKSYLEHEGYIS